MKSSSHFASSFAIGDSVNIDGDKSIRALVCAYLFRVCFVQVECSWFHNGELRTVWVEEWRLSDDDD